MVILNYRKRAIEIVLIVIFLSFASPSFAEKVTFVKEYTYQASELDSKASCRTISLEMVKRLLLEELGTYLISETEVKGFQLTKDKVTVLTAGIVRAEVVDDKWDGKTYWLKAKVSADPKEVTESLDNLRKDKEKTKEIEEARLKAKEALKEIDRLKKELEMVKTATATQKRQEEYQKEINRLSAVDWIEKGNSFFNVKKYDEAIEAYNKAIEFDIYYVAAYNNRGLAYANKGQHDISIADYNKAIELAPNFAMAYFNRGLANYSKKQYDIAIVDYSKAIEIDPNFASAYGGRGHVYMDKGHFDLALGEYKKAIELDSNSANTYLHRGFIYYKKGLYDMAIEDYSRAIEIDPNFALAYSGRAIAYDKKGQHDKAIEDLKTEKSLRETGTSWKAKTVKTTNKEKKDDYAKSGLSAKDWLEKGDLFLDAKKYDEAIKAYDMAIDLNPNYVNAYNSRGLAYNIKGQYDMAIEDYNKAIALDPNNAYAYYINRGLAYYKKGQYDMAIEDYNKAIALDPNKSTAYRNRGSAYNNKGQYGMAIEDYKTAAQLGDMGAQEFLRKTGITWGTGTVKTTNKEKKDDYAKSGLSAKDWLERGMALSTAGKISEAIDALSIAIELNPEEKRAYFYRGHAYSKSKDFQKALNDFNKMIDLDPQDALAFNTRALIYTTMGNYERSFNDYDLAISKNPDPVNMSSSYSGRGLNYIKLRKYSEAIVEYSKAIEINPSVGMFYTARAHAYAALKNYQKAIEDYDRAIFVDPQMSDAYYERGILKMEVGNREKGIEDVKKAAKLGDKEAQGKLNTIGIDWLADNKTDFTLKSEISKESQEKYLYNPQPHAVQKLEYPPFLFEMRGCKSVTDSITCDLVVINKDNKDRVLGISNDVYLLKKGFFSDTKTKPTRIVDNFGNEHKAKLIQFGGKKEEKPQALLVKDIPVRAVLMFDNISPLPSNLTLLEVGLFDDKDNIVTLRFSNIAVHDIKN